MAQRSHVLLTGATGLVGGMWLPRLLAADPERCVSVLARQPGKTKLEGHGRVAILKGDLALPACGLSEECRRGLAQSVTEIVHCAADIRFGLSLEQARGVNTCGTLRLLELASSCRHFRKFAHVSTVYVAGRGIGPVPETRFSNTAGFFNTYQQSKYDAEQLVADAMATIPAVVFRLSSIIGDSTTGVVQQFNYFHQLLKLVPRSALPVIPGVPDAPVDLIASDWAADALSTLYETHFAPGRFCNISAGPSNSLTVREIVETTFEQVRSQRKHSARAVPKMPEFVSLDEFEKFVQRQERNGNRRTRQLLGVIALFLGHLGVRQHFENGATLAALDVEGIQAPPIRDYYHKVVQYCLDSKWGTCKIAG